MTSNFQIDRREYTRYKVDIDTQVITPEFYISLNTLEISVEGIRIETYSEISPGTEVTLSFDLKKELYFHGKVIWVIGFHKKSILKYRIGIKVHELLLSGIKILGFDVKYELIQDILTKMKKLASKKTAT
jgi:hypothetical protein